MIRTTGTKVLVIPSIPAKQTPTGILLAVAWEQPANDGRVLSVGARVTDLKAGDHVSFSWIDGRTIEHEGKELKVFDQQQILGILE